MWDGGTNVCWETRKRGPLAASHGRGDRGRRGPPPDDGDVHPTTGANGGRSTHALIMLPHRAAKKATRITNRCWLRRSALRGAIRVDLRAHASTRSLVLRGVCSQGLPARRTEETDSGERSRRLVAVSRDLFQQDWYGAHSCAIKRGRNLGCGSGIAYDTETDLHGIARFSVRDAEGHHLDTCQCFVLVRWAHFSRTQMYSRSSGSSVRNVLRGAELGAAPS